MKFFATVVLGLVGSSVALPIAVDATRFRPSRFVRGYPFASKRTLGATIGTRGGQQDIVEEIGQKEAEKPPRFSLSLAPMVTALSSLAEAYGASLEQRPIVTKSMTACFIFALSDWLAQRLEATQEKETTIWTRTMSSALVGLLYFGPAAHVWYDTIFRILPGTSLVSTLQKAALGQTFFGPSFTCIFFATSLLQQGTFSFPAWWNKIRSDLPGAWLAGIGFWPLVDLVSYSMIPKSWIPLFVNACSLVWTIYLSTVSNRQVGRAD